MRHSLIHRISSTVRNPHVVLCLGACFTPDCMLVLEFVERGTVRAVLAAEPDLPTWRRLRMALDVARGMAFLHSLRPPVVHGDLTPFNVLVARHERWSLGCDVTVHGLTTVRAQ
jgi:tRNA A-37 threonylcarbamoyl transferase component Bud32